MIKQLLACLIVISFTVSSHAFAAEVQKENKKSVKADNEQEVYELIYIEREPDVDEYEVTKLVSGRYVRTDIEGDDSGYILYDDSEKVLYSVSHHDKTVLVIKQHAFSEKDSPVKSQVEYLQLSDAPSVDGKDVYNYRVFTGEGASEETCLEIQLVENLLPEVNKMLKNYQAVVSGQQVKLTDNKVTDLQPACYFVDMVYNAAKYHDKGLPIQEWHSNETSSILSSYKKVKVNRDKFTLPEKYRRYSVDKKSKIPLQ